MKPANLSILVAMASNHVIGNNNQLPWHLSADLKHFKALTMGHNIIMGRKTYESIGKPLPGRINVIVTHQNNYQIDGATVVNSVDEAIEVSIDDKNSDRQSFIIGGAELYQQTLPLCQHMYITEIQQEFTGDTFFPKFDPDEWSEISREKHIPEDSQPLEYHFVVLDRKMTSE